MQVNNELLVIWSWFDMKSCSWVSRVKFIASEEVEILIYQTDWHPFRRKGQRSRREEEASFGLIKNDCLQNIVQFIGEAPFSRILVSDHWYSLMVTTGATVAQSGLAVQIPLNLSLSLCHWATHFTYIAWHEGDWMSVGGGRGHLAVIGCHAPISLPLQGSCGYI